MSIIPRNTKIARKILRHILLIECFCFLLTTALSVLVLRPRLKQQFVRVAAATHSQAAVKIDAVLESITTASQYIVASAELQDALSSYEKLPSLQSSMAISISLNHLASSQPDILGIVLDMNNGARADSFFLTEAESRLFSSPRYTHLKNSKYSQNFELLQEAGTYTLVSSRNCCIGSRSYILSVFYHGDNLFSELRRLTGSIFSGFCIVNSELSPIYTGGQVPLGEISRADMLSGQDKDGLHTIKSGSYFADILEANSWSLITYVDRQSMELSYRSMLLSTILLFTLLCISTLLLFTPAINHMIKPLGQLAESMRSVTNGNLHPAAVIDSGDEIGELSRKFNIMVDSINASIQKIVEHEQREQKMKYSLLVSQIDPHFIYNTMGIITILAKSGKTDEIVAINTALIKIMQDRLRIEDIKVYDTIRQEADTAEQYLLIQSYRYDYHVNVVWNVPEDVWMAAIPKNLLQPLIENALFHGLMDEESGRIEGEIDIRAAREAQGLRIVVHDNGQGIDPAVIDRLLSADRNDDAKRGRHIGLRNIRERLNYLYPSCDCLKIERDHGTTVTIFLPDAAAQ
jgi:two-component system sensor histidine kinase YesM